MKEIAMFDLFDQEMAKYLGLTLRTYIEKMEELGTEKEEIFANLFQQWLDGENVKDDILELFGLTSNEEI